MIVSYLWLLREEGGLRDVRSGIITLALHGLKEPLFVLLCNFFSGGK